MATLTKKDKTKEELTAELTRGARSSSLSIPAVSSNNTKREYGLIDAYMDNLKKSTFQAPSTNNLLPYSIEDMTIKQYESIPNYNAFERMTDKSKADAYERKQGLLSAYQDAKKNKTERAMQSGNISIGTIEHALGNIVSVDENSDMASLKAKHNEAVQQLNRAGLSLEDAEDYYYNVYSQQKTKENFQKKAQENPVKETLFSFPMNAIGGVAGTLEGVSSYLTGKPIDSNSGMFMPTKLANTTRETVSGDMGTVGKTLYDAGTAIGDNLTSMALTLGNNKLAGALQGLQGFSNSVIDASERGTTPNKIMGTATADAITEAIMEMIPMGKLGKIAEGVGLDGSVKSVLKTIGSQMLTEGATEAATEVTSAVADLLINQDLSNFALNVKKYRDNGMTTQEAKIQAWKDLAGQVGYAGVTGALAGGVMGGGATAYNRMKANAEVPYLREETKASENTESDPISMMKKLDPLNAFGWQEIENVLKKPSDVENASTNLDILDVSSNNEIEKSELIKAFEADNHTPEQLKVMEDYKNASEQDILDFVNKARDKNIPYVRPLIVTEMNDAIADYVFETTGIDTHGNNIIISKDTITHIDKEHGFENTEGKSRMSDDDLSRIKWVLDNAEEVVVTNRKSNATRTKDGQRAPHIMLRKRIDGHYYVVEAVTDGKSKNNVVVSAFIEETGKERGDVANIFKEPYRVPNAFDGASSNPSANVQDVHELGSNNNIPNSNQNVNNTVTPEMVQRIAALRAGNNQQSSNQRVRGYNDTLIDKTDAPQELKKEFINNPDMYTQLSNADTLAQAMEIMESNDINTAIAKYHSLLDNKNPVAVPLGYNLSKQLSQAGRLDESVQLVREMSRALTESGQFSQAAAITMLNNDPEAAKRYLIREIDTMNQKGREKYGKKWTDFELTENELQQFANIETGDADAIRKAYETVYNRLRKQYPATMTEKLLEFRRVSMLLNVRTNVRNVVSNALMFPVRWTADRVSALGEGVYCLINPKYQRTQAINPIRSQQSKKLASEAFETVRSELLGDSKYEDAKEAMRDKQVFKDSKTARMIDTITNGAITKANQAMNKDADPSLLETARNFTYFLLQKGDDVFVRKNFESRMASYLDAQGITDLENIPADAYVLATQEALKATFKDDSKLANTMSSFRQLFNGLPGHFIGEAIMPFTKTPANLAMRGIDYSPAGVYNGVKTLRNAQNSADIAKGITQLGQAATGTAAIALGYVLAQAGLISGALSDDKDEAQFQKQQGMLPYAINVNGNYFSYDWAQPASIPLILGVTLHDCWENNRGWGNAVKSGTLAAIDSWLELSPLQNLADIFGGYGTTSENIWDVLSTDLPLSFLPAQMGAVAKIGDTTQRVTYDPNSYWNNLTNQAKAKVPGLSETLPVAYDTWGNPIQRQDSTWEAALANLFNPGQFGNANVSPIDDEISALYKSTNDASVFPRKAAWTENDVKLDTEQYSEFQRIMGENVYAMTDAFINSANYGSMDDELKVKVIGEIHSFAHALAKSEVTGYDITGSQSYKKAYSIFREKGADGVATYYAITANKNGQSNASLVNAVNALDVSTEDRGYYLTVLLGDLSKEATEAYRTGGYEAVYNLYSQKTAAERIKQLREQSAAERIAALRNGTANSGVSADAVARIRALREGTAQQSQEMQEAIERIRRLRSQV